MQGSMLSPAKAALPSREQDALGLTPFLGCDVRRSCAFFKSLPNGSVHEKMAHDGYALGKVFGFFGQVEPRGSTLDVEIASCSMMVSSRPGIQCREGE